ncbi:MAG: replication initiator [Egibacteraceae bacterium]
MSVLTTGDLGAALVEILARGEDAERIQDQARAVGGCEHPIRLRGHLDTIDRHTGEVEQRWSSEGLADGVIHTRCNNRRASRCEPCSRLYQADAWQLVVSGLKGGKGVPETVAGHPTLFVTLTAPSFGPVHSSATDESGRVNPCRARRDQVGEVCEHGQATTCATRHAEDDPALGRPLCMDCWDYAGAVLWNAHASELWRRTRIRVYRELAALTGISERALKQDVSVQYVKVAEYQKRGLVHFHLLIRLDAARPPAVQRLGVPWRLPHRITPPPERYTVKLLARAVRSAVAHVEVGYPAHLTDASADGQGGEAQGPGREVGAGQGPEAFPQGTCRQAPLTRDLASTLEARDPSGSLTQPTPFGPPTGRDGVRHRLLPDVSVVPKARCARWGRQLDVREVQGEERGKVAGYLAKYAVKHTEAVGGLDRRLKVDDLALLAVPEHIWRLVVVAWRLALRDPGLRTDRWAHQLGYGGHFLTKSRHYSTTFTKLRAARARWAAWQRALSQVDPWELFRETARQALVKRWQVAGFGWRLSGDALLAQTVREQAQAAREAAREARTELTDVLALAG